MTASLLDLRRRPGTILKALERNERVTLTYRGKPRGIIHPIAAGPRRASVAGLPAVGMWKDHAGFRDVAAAVRRMRAPRHRI